MVVVVVVVIARLVEVVVEELDVVMELIEVVVVEEVDDISGSIELVVLDIAGSMELVVLDEGVSNIISVASGVAGSPNKIQVFLMSWSSIASLALRAASPIVNSSPLNKSRISSWFIADCS